MGIEQILLSIANTPQSLLICILQLALGFALGYMFKSFLKISIIVGFLLFIFALLGLWNPSLNEVERYLSFLGPYITRAISSIITIVPFTVGFITGIFVGILKG